ncbi:MAG: beta-lactamase family protein [Armatimonadetes bacterium]|nr:beta-lactamase family protein [Armatimonadota bacterium]
MDFHRNTHPSAQPAAGRLALGARVDEFVCEEMKRQRVPGLAVGIVKGGAVLKAQGYGLANLEHQVPVGPATLFQSGSLGKQLTAAAVMLQVDDGKVSLSDPVTRFFPDAPETWRAITVRHLLTHTSGIADHGGGTLNVRQDYSEEELARLAFGLPLQFPPGARWLYSNNGYILLGIIVHQVSGSFYGDVLAERVFRPLGMATARVISQADITPNRAAGYHLAGESVKNQGWVSPSLNATADGSLHLSVRDVIAWDAGVRARALLQPESWDLTLRPARLTSGKPYPYGFGWFLDERNGQPLQQHGGSWQGFKTHFSRFIGEDLSVIILANLSQTEPARFADGIAAIMNPKLALTLEPIADREPEVTARLSRLLEDARAGRLDPAEFGHLRAGFFPGGARALQEQIRALGPSQAPVLVERVEKGDDRIYTYEVAFAARAMRYMVGLAPDDQVSLFQLRGK